MIFLRKPLVVNPFSIIIILITTFVIFSCNKLGNEEGDDDEIELSGGDGTGLSDNQCSNCSSKLDDQGNCPSCSSNTKHECIGKDCDGICVTPLENCAGKTPKFTCSNCKKNIVGQEHSICEECNNKNTKCKIASCKGNKPLKNHDTNDICPDCSTKGKCNLNTCQGNIPLKDHDNDGVCNDCKKDIKCKATNGLCDGKHPLNIHDDEGFCPDCIAHTKCKSICCLGNSPKKEHDNQGFCPGCIINTPCKANNCNGNHPLKDHDNKGNCKACRELKAKCKAINCKGDALLKNHDNDGFCNNCNENGWCKSGFCDGNILLKDHNKNGICSDCLDQQTYCKADTTDYPCDGNQLLKDHNDKGHCSDCLAKNHKCKDPHNSCLGNQLLKDHDEKGICSDCNDQKVHCRLSSCTNSTILFKDFDSNGYCADCGANEKICKANQCLGNQLLKDHDEKGICSDCSADKTKQLNIDLMDFKDLKPLFEKFKSLNIGITTSDFKNINVSQVAIIRKYFKELQRLKIYKGTIGKRDVVNLKNTSFIYNNFNKANLVQVYYYDSTSNTWHPRSAGVYTNIRLKKPLKIPYNSFRWYKTNSSHIPLKGVADGEEILIMSSDIHI